MLYVSSLPQVRDFAQQEAFRIDSSSLIPFIEKELLHIDLLNSFVPQMQNTSLVFQGGTALRLCYGAPRYSEDLDFSVGSDFYQAEKLNSLINENLIKQCNGEVSLKQPKDSIWNRNDVSNQTKVAKWFVKYDLNPNQRDIPLQKIKLEAASIGAHTSLTKNAICHYPQFFKEFPDLKILDPNYRLKMISNLSDIHREAFGNIKKPSAHQRLSERNHDLRQASKALSNERTDRQIDSFDKTEH